MRDRALWPPPNRRPDRPHRRARDRDSQDSAFGSASGWASGVGADPKKRHLKTPLKPPGRSSPQGNMDGDTEDNCHRKLWLRRGRTCNTLVTDTPVPPTRARGSDGSKRSENDHLFSVSDVPGSMLNTRKNIYISQSSQRVHEARSKHMQSLPCAPHPKLYAR